MIKIRSRCGQLEPSAGQVLHATFFGAKRPNADVENVALYYIDSFRSEQDEYSEACAAQLKALELMESTDLMNFDDSMFVATPPLWKW